MTDSRTLELKDLGLERRGQRAISPETALDDCVKKTATFFLLLVYMNHEVVGALPAQTLLVPNFRLTPLSLRADDSENLALNCSSSD